MSKTQQQPVPMRLMAYLDGEMSPREARDFERLLEEHPEWLEEANFMKDVTEGVKVLKVRRPEPAFWDHYWEEIDSRLQKSVGWFVAMAGALLLIVAGFAKVLTYAENDFVRLGIVLVGIGVLILFVMALRGRLLEMPRDRYWRIRK